MSEYHGQYTLRVVDHGRRVEFCADVAGESVVAAEVEQRGARGGWYGRAGFTAHRGSDETKEAAVERVKQTLREKFAPIAVVFVAAPAPAYS